MSKQPAWLKKVKKGGNQKKEMLNIQLVNKNNVMLSGPYSIFGDQLKNIIKACEGKYIAEDKGWLVPRNYLDSILASIQNEQLNIPINKIPGFVDRILHPFNGIIAYKTKSEPLKLEYQPADRTKQLSDLPEEFSEKLYAFQKKGVEFGVRNFGRVLIADEMGVGKTIQALGLACMYKADWPFLVISPSSLRLNWRDEIFRWIVDMGPREVQVITKSATEIRSGIKVLIISYDLASKMADALDDYKFQMAIVDEAHYLKNGEAKRTENLVPIIRKCKRCILLTGTPAFAKPKELFNLMHILRPDVFTNFKEFGIRYCDPKPNPFSGALDYNGAVNMKELHYILMNSFMIRRLKKDVLTELPPKRRQKIEVKLDNQYVKKIQDAISKSKGGQLSTIVESLVDTFMMPDEVGYEAEANRFEEEKSRENPEVLQCYLYTGLAKIPGIKEYIHDLAQNDIKMLVFAHHFEVLNAIEEEVKKLKLKYIRIDGKVEVNKRYESVKLFQEDESVKIAILSLTAAGVGLTLTAASTVIFAEMYWTPAVMLQAEDRIHRMGQKNKVCVNYHYLYGEGTLDSLLYEKLQTKLAIVSEILEGKTEYLNVEETKEGMGEFQETPTPEPEKKKKKDAYGKEKRDSSSKPVGPMNQITSYFSKKPAQSNTNTDSGKPMDSSERRNNYNEKSNGVDSLDWDDIDAMLEKDKIKKDSEKASLEKIPQPFNQNDEDEFDLEMIEQMCGQEKSRGERLRGQGSKEEFEESVFYDCLGEILESERSKREDSNNKDIRGFFNKDAKARESTKKLIPVAEDEEDGLLSLWKKDDVTPDNKTGKMTIEKHQQQQQDLWGTSEKTPTRSLENSFSKKTAGNTNSHAKSGPFRFSLQPKSRDQSESKLSQSFTSNESKSSKKRKLDIIDAELEKENNLEIGITSNILKKVKITTNMGQILEGNDEE